MDQLTTAEKEIIALLRSLMPFEKVLIEADKGGKPNTFVVSRSRKGVLVDGIIIYT